jgi:GNAT superfamily N-acetyltransferase
MIRPSLSIRPATPGDAETIHRSILDLARHVGEMHKVRSTAADLARHMFGADPALYGLVAEVAGAYAGRSLYFRSFSTWHGRPGVYVQDLWVEERFRGGKVGEALLQRVASLARASGGIYMRLAVDVRNFGAQRFYSRLGIVHSDTEQVHAIYGDAFMALAAGDADGSLEDR